MVGPLFRLYGQTSTMRITVAQAREFIETLTREYPNLDEPEGAREAERSDLWRRVQEL